jgi:hypothetical protein
MPVMTSMSAFDRLRNSLDYRRRDLLSRYYYGNRYPWQRHIRQKRFAQSQRVLRDEEPDLLKLIDRILEGMGRDPERPSSRHSDALFLMDQVFRRRPRWILECGAGASTLIFAYALAKLKRLYGHDGGVVSVDESPEYLAKMVQPHLSESLAPLVSFHASPVAYWRYDNLRTGRHYYGIGYGALPRQAYDFVYVDGPQVRQGGYHGVQKNADGGSIPAALQAKPFDCDALNVLLDGISAPQVTVVIDQRIDTRWQLKQVLSAPYPVAYCYAPRKSVFDLTAANVAFVARKGLDPDRPSTRQ